MTIWQSMKFAIVFWTTSVVMFVSTIVFFGLLSTTFGTVLLAVLRGEAG